MDFAAHEIRRHELFGELQTMGDDPRRSLDAITRTAAYLTETPIALVSLIAGDHQYLVSHFGWDAERTPRSDSFCTHTIGQPDLFEVPEARNDPRVCHSPLVTGPPHLRAYFGKTLHLDGVPVGTLCVIDQRARQLQADQRAALLGLAAGAEAVLSSHRSLRLLRDSAERLADFATASGDWFWETDAQLRVTWTSPGLAEAWRVAGEFRPGALLPAAAICDDVGATSSPPQMLTALLARRERFPRTTICHLEGADPVFLSLAGVPRIENGVFAGFRGTARNITARVLDAREGRLASRALQRISAVVPGLIYQLQIHPDGRASMNHVSHNIEPMFEMTAFEARRDIAAISRRIHPDDLPPLCESIKQAAPTGDRWHATYRVNLPQRGERVHSAQATPESQEDGSVVWYGIVTDVTEEVSERQRLEALRVERDIAARSAEAKTDLMSRVSHELRTPLNAIVGFAQLLRLRFPDVAVEPGRSARHIHHASEHLLSLINDILDIAALEAGRFELNLQPMAIGAAIERGIDMVTPQAAQRQVRFVVKVAPTVSGIVADERATRQILLNLMANAVHFSPPGSTIHVRVEAGNTPDQVNLTVRDEGPGVSDAQRDHLFAPFERMGAADRYAGSGLGLSISRKLAQMMGGDIRLLDGCPGACFCLTLPAAREPVPDRAATDFQGLYEAPPQATGVPAAAYRLLYIEDDPVNALVMEGFIGLFSGVNFQVATTCAQGLQAAQSQPDLIFLDMHLPDGDGFSVVRALKADARTREIPVIAVSADAMPEQISAALREGFEDYITKPIEYAQLARALTSWFHDAGGRAR